MFPVGVEPFWVTLLVTIVAMSFGTVPVGGGLFPVVVLQLGSPHCGSVSVFSKPLKAEGAGPPESLFAEAHWFPHHVTVGSLTDRSPIANAPFSGSPYTVAVDSALPWIE